MWMPEGFASWRTWEGRRALLSRRRASSTEQFQEINYKPLQHILFWTPQYLHTPPPLILLLMVPDDTDLVVELKTGDRQTNLRSVLHEVEDADLVVHVNLRAALESKPRLRDPHLLVCRQVEAGLQD